MSAGSARPRQGARAQRARPPLRLGAHGQPRGCLPRRRGARQALPRRSPFLRTLPLMPRGRASLAAWTSSLLESSAWRQWSKACSKERKRPSQRS